MPSTSPYEAPVTCKLCGKQSDDCGHCQTEANGVMAGDGARSCPECDYWADRCPSFDDLIAGIGSLGQAEIGATVGLALCGVRS